MKLLSVFLFLCCMQVSAHMNAQHIYLKEKDTPIEKILAKIKSQTGYNFMYESKVLAKAGRVTLDVAGASLQTVLDLCFKDQPVSWRIIGSVILLKERALPEPNVVPEAVMPPPVQVTGKVMNEKGEPVSGATVAVEGSSVATATAADGSFTITVPDATAKLVFSYVGYMTVTRPVGKETVVHVSLQAASNALDEIVIVGYGSQKRKDVTGAVASLNEKTLKEVPVTSAPQMLQGRVAGVFVTQSSNRPGAQPTIRVRGTRSIQGGNDPLFVVDGIPIQGGFNDLNPNDIASMEVLKDASATAIYGSRGSNGVVIITTKRGKEGKPTISYNTYLGVTQVTRYAPMMDAAKFLNVIREANRKADGTIPGDENFLQAEPLARVKAGNNTDWQRLVTENGFTHNHELAVRGGNKGTRYNLSLGYFNDKGYFKTQDFSRYTVRMNLDQDVSSKVKVGLSMLGAYSENNTPGSYYTTLVESPFGLPYKADGSLDPQPNYPDNLMWNPLMDLQKGNLIRLEKRFRLLTALYGEAEIVRGLKFRTNFGPDLTNSRSGSFNGSLSTQSRGAAPSASTSESFAMAYTWENYLTYDKLIADKHRVNATALYSYQQQVTESSGVGAINLPVESLEYYNLGVGVNSNMSSSYQKWNLISYMGRLNYSFDSRLLVTFTVRADGSSRFAPGNKWGIFSSGAVAWNLSNEAFIRRASWIDNLKLRLSYGQVGNTGINPYQTQGILGNNLYEFNGTRAPGRFPNSIRNTGLKWERTAKANLGIDFAVLKNRVSGSVDLYDERTTDLLLPFALPGTTGFTTTLRNVGSTSNKGIEVTLSTQNLRTASKFQWNTDFNMAYNQEKIIELSQGKIDDLANLRFIGAALNPIFDYEKIGIWQTSEADKAAALGLAPGQIKVKDQDGNGKIGPEDRKILGKTRPPLTMGLNNTFAYKGFDFAVFVVANTGFLLSSPIHGDNYNTLAGRYNNLDVDYWTPSNPTNDHPKPRITGNQYLSTLRYFSGDFVRIRNVSLGYNIPSAITQKIKAQSIRAYVNVTNPYVFSSYVHKNNGIDPEIMDTPATVNILFGLNVNF